MLCGSRKQVFTPIGRLSTGSLVQVFGDAAIKGTESPLHTLIHVGGATGGEEGCQKGCKASKVRGRERTDGVIITEGFTRCFSG